MSRKVIPYFVGIFVSVGFPAFGGLFVRLPDRDYIPKHGRETAWHKPIWEPPGFSTTGDREETHIRAHAFVDSFEPTYRVSPVAVTPDGRGHSESGQTILEGPMEALPGSRIALETANTIFNPLDQISHGPAAGHWVIAVAVTPHGHHVVSASGDQIHRFWDLKSGQLLRTLENEIAYRVGCAVPYNAGTQAGH